MMHFWGQNPVLNHSPSSACTHANHLSQHLLRVTERFDITLMTFERSRTKRFDITLMEFKRSRTKRFDITLMAFKRSRTKRFDITLIAFKRSRTKRS